MNELAEPYLGKARESLNGAFSELANGRYNNAANRACYAATMPPSLPSYEQGFEAAAASGAMTKFRRVSLAS